MQIILVSKNKNKSRALYLGPINVLVCLFIIMSASVLFFQAGKQQALDVTRHSLQSLYARSTLVWSHEIELQQSLLDEAQKNAEKNLDALATRLSKLQAHVMRLDALGSRLADMADISDIDFGVDTVPGIGGPQPIQMNESMEVTDFITSLEQLSLKIQDRAEKLYAMESMLIDKTLQSETTPIGKPISLGWVSSLFGIRADPITGKKEFHQGVDYAGRTGSPINAVAAGIVTWSGARYGYGNMVEINHGNGYQTRYAHNKKNLVAVGEKVEKGQVIALMGFSGRATGSHVHFEVVKNGKAVNPTKIRSIK